MKRIFLAFFLVSGLIMSQDKDSLDFSQYTLFENDSLITDLEEVQLLPKLEFKSYNDKRYYYWFRKKVLKAYPYAKIASEEISKLNEALDSIPSKRKKKRYTKEVRKYLEKEFTPQLKKLTRTEGRVLIKLMHRETGEVTYDLVKEYRSGWKAFWYNATANMFKMSLKDGYDPVNVQEDYMIEDVLQRAWRDNLIELDKAKLEFDFANIKKKWDLGYPPDYKKKK
ncbi:DUF4294 domain-containing protein [Flavicella sp.]|uniref:DUF4294 domain-containing protein n=1 Tax=Flavicella sp. TaxID=2957742 RepID=UPI00262CA2B9|nr:DUF4294 domain-containing protein [Flavicella sp.]MDG1803450.1 DUF4294 domain-containing protein [Flavicella sp.]MDG2279733.1 DUF4294 domain-containing protein [Flavicella sp.]